MKHTNCSGRPSLIGILYWYKVVPGHSLSVKCLKRILLCQLLLSGIDDFGEQNELHSV